MLLQVTPLTGEPAPAGPLAPPAADTLQQNNTVIDIRTEAPVVENLTCSAGSPLENAVKRTVQNQDLLNWSS